MPADLLAQCGLLLATAVTPFAVSSIVGMLVARLWATQHPLVGAPVEPSSRPWWPDPTDEAPTAWLPAENLAPPGDPLT